AGIPDSSRLPQLGALDVRSRRARDCELHSCQVNVGDYSRSVASACLHTFQKRTETLAKKPRESPRGERWDGVRDRVYKDSAFLRTQGIGACKSGVRVFLAEIRGKNDQLNLTFAVEAQFRLFSTAHAR